MIQGRETRLVFVTFFWSSEPCTSCLGSNEARMTEEKFRFHDPRSYIHVVEGQTYLTRPRLNPKDRWSVRNWLVLPITRQPYSPRSLKSVSKMVIQNLTDSIHLHIVATVSSVVCPGYISCCPTTMKAI